MVEERSRGFSGRSFVALAAATALSGLSECSVSQNPVIICSCCEGVRNDALLEAMRTPSLLS